MKSMKYALAFAAMLAALPAAAAQTYVFIGYVACVKGQIGCGQWPSTHNWVRLTFGNGLDYATCKAAQDVSRALTGGDGFCDPFIP